MKTLPALLATAVLLSFNSTMLAEDAPKAKDEPTVKEESTAKDEPKMNVKDTDWVVVSVPKTTAKDGKATAKIKIKGAGIKQDCDLWVNLSKFVGTTRKHNVAKKEPVALKAGADVEQEVSFAVPADAGAVIFTVFTMPTGKTAWSDKLQSLEVASTVK